MAGEMGTKQGQNYEGSIWEELKAPFPNDSLKWRVGATSRDKTRCMALAYMDARMVMRRLDGVVGEANWNTNVFMASDGRCVCRLTIRVSGIDPNRQLRVDDDASDPISIERSDASGFSQNGGRKGFTYGDMVKGAASEAFKRAAAQFGIGRYLYDLEAKWVPYDERRKEITAEGLEMLGGGQMDESVPPPQDESSAASAPATTRRKAERKPGTHRQDGTTRGKTVKTGRDFISGDSKRVLYRENFRAVEAVHGKAGVEDLTTNAKFEPVNFATQKLGADRIDNLYEDQVGEAQELIQSWAERYKEPAQTEQDNDPVDQLDDAFEL